MKRKIVNKPSPDGWGYDDIAWTKYDEAVIVPYENLYDGSHKSVFFDEVAKTIKVGKTYRLKQQYGNKKLKAKLLSIYSDPIGFGNPKKKMPVRLGTEWQYLEGNEYVKGRHVLLKDVDLEYYLRPKKRQKIHDKLWQKYGMKKIKAVEEIKKLIKEGKY